MRRFAGALIVALLGACGEGAEQVTVIYRDASGRQITEKDLDGYTGVVNFELVGSENVPEEAMRLHREARAAGGKGDYDAALQLLEKARKAAPAWPYPVYDAARTSLLKGEFERAEEYYRQTDALAPRGFFMSKAALDSLTREREGRVKRGSYLAVIMQEWVQDAAARRKQLEAIVKTSPDLPVAWQKLASEIDDDNERLVALEEGLKRSPDAGTRAFLLTNKALLLARRGKREEAINILGPLALDTNGTLDGVAFAQLALKRLPKP